MPSVTGTRKWSKYSANLYLGCHNDCRYCYGRAAALRYKRIKDCVDWVKMVYQPTLAARELTLKKVDGVIMFPTVHDIFPWNLSLCLMFLKNVLQRGNKVLIVSKPNFICIEKLCRDLALYKQQILFRFTIGSRNNDVLGFWEPYAPRYEERLASLNEAWRQGYKTSVSIEPMLDKDVDRVYYAVEPYVTETIWIGKMNHIKERVDMKDWGEKELHYRHEVESVIDDGFILELYDKLRNETKVRWKGSLKQLLGMPLPAQPGLDQ